MLPLLPPSIFMGFYFFPRGGSAQVARYLCRALRGGRWEPRLFAGSVGTLADNSNADRFFSRRSLRVTGLLAGDGGLAWRCGRDGRVGSDVRVVRGQERACRIASSSISTTPRSMRRSPAGLGSFGPMPPAAPSVVHLHHLTPIHEAVRALWPDVPVVTHLHGTELKMLASADEAVIADGAWRWKGEWVERMRRWARDSVRVVVVSAHDQELVHRLLPVDPARITTIANGVDTELFSPHFRDSAERLALWRHYLVDDPQGWRPGGSPGSIRYDEGDLSAFTDAAGQPVPVVLFAGRFMRFKRLQLLIEAHHAMRSTTSCRSVLVVAGGFPCEWEGEHPYDTVQRLGAEGVFFVGWHDHDELSDDPQLQRRVRGAVGRRAVRPRLPRSDGQPGFRRSPPTPADRCRSSTSIPSSRPDGWCHRTTSPRRPRP